MLDNWAEAAAKAVVYGAVLLAVGAVAVRTLLLPRTRGRVPDAPWEAWNTRADGMLAKSAVALLIGLALRLWTHTVSAFGVADAWSFESLHIIGIESRWGQGWHLQVLAAVGVAATALWALRGRRAGRIASTLATLVLCAALPTTGHAAGHPWRIVLHSTHILAAGLWLGTLSLVATGRTGRLRPLRPHLLRAFAPLAMTGATVLALSGLSATWIYLGPLSNLWLTDYGRLLVVKVALVAGVLVLGALNWQRLHRHMAEEAHERHVVAEVVLAVLIVGLTAWLTETAHPS